jgi:hypothetical protein
MRRGKAGTMRTIIDKKTDVLRHFHILAGACAHNDLFNDLAADDIAERRHQHHAQYPPEPLYFEIDGDK